MIIINTKERFVTLQELKAEFEEIQKQLYFGIRRSVSLSIDACGRLSMLVDGIYRVTANTKQGVQCLKL